MKHVMRNAFLCLGICLTLSGTANAYNATQQQEKRVTRHELPNPEKDAERIATEMKKTLDLSDKQYKKVYKFYLKQQKEIVEEMSSNKNSKDKNRPPMPPQDGNRPPRGERPDMVAGDGKPGGPKMKDGEKSPMQERIEKEQKQMKKILSDEQYEKWLKMKPGRK